MGDGKRFATAREKKNKDANDLRSCGLHRTASRSSSFRVSRFGIGRNEGMCGDSKSMVDSADAL